MVELLPFGSVKSCPKCGGTVFGRKYMPQYQTFGQAGGIAVFQEIDNLPERLEVACTACGYRWGEQCADADRDEGQGKDGG